MTFEEILITLPKLAPEQLDEIDKRIKALRSLSKHTYAPDTDADLAISCLVHVMRGLGLDQSPSTQLVGSNMWANFQRKIPDLFDFLRQGAKDRVELQALLNLGFKLLVQNMLAASLPVSSRLVMAHVHRIPSMINKSFPGYAQADMLNWIVKQEVKHGI